MLPLILEALVHSASQMIQPVVEFLLGQPQVVFNFLTAAVKMLLLSALQVPQRLLELFLLAPSLLLDVSQQLLLLSTQVCQLALVGVASLLGTTIRGGTGGLCQLCSVLPRHTHASAAHRVAHDGRGALDELASRPHRPFGREVAQVQNAPDHSDDEFTSN
jgi:hypothetical protein